MKYLMWSLIALAGFGIGACFQSAWPNDVPPQHSKTWYLETAGQFGCFLAVGIVCLIAEDEKHRKSALESEKRTNEQTTE